MHYDHVDDVSQHTYSPTYMYTHTQYHDFLVGTICIYMGLALARPNHSTDTWNKIATSLFH